MVTIIIPIYNTSTNLLKRCVDSVLVQTETNWELIMVDDGSCEETAQAVDEIARLDCRIKAKHQGNKGVSTARNLGLKFAMGDYIAFIDSDDTVEPEYLQQAVEHIEKYNLDVIIGGACFVSDAGRTQISINLPEKESIKIYDNERVDLVTQQMLEDKSIPEAQELADCRNGGPCWRLYKKEILQNLEFNTDIFVLEDKIFNLYAFLKAKRIGICRDMWYNYYQYENSAIHQYQPNLINNCTAIIASCQDVIKAVPKQLSASIQRFEVAQLSMLLQNAVCHAHNKSKLSQKIETIRALTKNQVWIDAFQSIPQDVLPFKKRILRRLFLNQSNKLLWLVTKLFQLKTKL